MRRLGDAEGSAERGALQFKVLALAESPDVAHRAFMPEKLEALLVWRTGTLNAATGRPVAWNPQGVSRI